MQCLQQVLRSFLHSRQTTQCHEEDKRGSPPPPLEYSAPPRYDTDGEGTDGEDTDSGGEEEDATRMETTVMLLDAEGKVFAAQCVEGSIQPDLMKMQALCDGMEATMETLWCTMSKGVTRTFRITSSFPLENAIEVYEKTRRWEGRLGIEMVYVSTNAVGTANQRVPARVVPQARTTSSIVVALTESGI